MSPPVKLEGQIRFSYRETSFILCVYVVPKALESDEMLCEVALDLIRELQRSKDTTLPPYNEDGVRQASRIIDFRYIQAINNF